MSSLMIKVTRVQRIITKISWFFDLLPLGHLSMLYTIILVSSLPYTCKLGSRNSFLSHPTPPRTTAASPLFRYHLHINAVRELAGMHLMWRQQFLQIFVASLYSSFIQCLTSNRDATLKNVQVDKTFLLTSDPHFRDDFSPRTSFGLSSTILISSSSTIPIITSFDHPRSSEYPRTGPQAQYVQF